MSGRTCKPYDRQTNPHGGFCFPSGLSKLLGVKYDDHCIECFAAAGFIVDNASRPDHHSVIADGGKQ